MVEGGTAPRLKVSLGELKAIAQMETEDGTALIDDESFRGRISALEIRTSAFEFAELVTLDAVSRGGSPGTASSLAKNSGVEIDQGINELKLEAVQHYGLPHANLISLNGYNEPWVGPEYAETVTAKYLNARAASVFGGAKEVQKNIIAKAVLGL